MAKALLHTPPRIGIRLSQTIHAGKGRCSWDTKFIICPIRRKYKTKATKKSAKKSARPPNSAMTAAVGEMPREERTLEEFME